MNRKRSRKAIPLRAVRVQTRSRNLTMDGDMLTKRMTISSNTIPTTAGGIIAVATYSNGTVQSNPATEWASFAARYQQFRVKSFTIRFLPVFPVNTGMTATTGHSSLYVSDFIGTALPGSAAQVLADERSRVFSTSKSWSYTVTSRRNPNALLWNPTSAALPAANSMSIAFASSTVATMPVSQTMGQIDFEFIIELRGAQ